MSENVPLNSEQGKQTVDALMAKMTPEQQAEFKAALESDKPVHVHMGKDGTVSLGEAALAAEAAVTGATPAAVEPAPEAPVEVKKEEPPEPRKPSKLDQKRQQIFVDRMKRHMGKGLTQEQAIQAIQREDYDAMPLDKKFSRLETVVAQTFRRLGSEIMNLSQEHMAIGDAFDINYRALQKMFIKLGISNEEQKVFLDEAQQEVIEIRKKEQADRQLAQMNAQRAQQAATEKAQVEEELKNAESKAAAEPAGSEIPKEATVFGG